jgi:hypothetical protein
MSDPSAPGYRWPDSQTQVMLTSPWRVGGSLGRTIFAHPPGHEAGIVIGMLDSAALSEHVVTQHNLCVTQMRVTGDT